MQYKLELKRCCTYGVYNATLSFSFRLISHDFNMYLRTNMQKRATLAEQETENTYKELDKLKRLVAVPKEEFGGEANREGDNDQQWREEFAPSYGVEEPSSWFSGYDRCNI